MMLLRVLLLLMREGRLLFMLMCASAMRSFARDVALHAVASGPVAVGDV